MIEFGRAAGVNGGNAAGADRFSAPKGNCEEYCCHSFKRHRNSKKRGSGLQVGDPWHLRFKATVKINHSDGLLKAYGADSQLEETLRCGLVVTL